MIGCAKDAILRQCVRYFVLLYDHFFLEDFDGVQALRSFLAAQDHFSERPFAENFDEFEVLQCLKKNEKV